MSPEEEIQRAVRAEQILKDELFKEAVKDIRESLVTGIELAAFTDEKMREKLSQQLVALRAIVNKLHSHIETGVLAEETIKRRRATR